MRARKLSAEVVLAGRELDPAALPVGTRVGPWRIQGWGGRGNHGSVYRVVHVEEERARSFALKMAQHAGDARFGREVELLSRIQHRGIPQLYGHGVWRHRMGDFPFLVMEWVPGVPLYEWAARRNPTVGQAVRVLAELAWALEAVSGAAGAHRDVTGSNVLVVPGTGRVVLTDFGSGKFRGAATLTNHVLPPGTPVYRSPEAWEFARLFSQHPSAHYEPGMCDDLFSLGMLGYRLVTDEYPPPTDPGEKGSSVWYGGGGPRGPRELNPNVSEELDAILRRLLEVHPVERFKGVARLAAEALERAAWGPGVDRRLFDWDESGAAGPIQERPGGEQWERRPRLRSRQVVRRTEEQDEAARVEHERQEREAQQAEGERVESSCGAEEREKSVSGALARWRSVGAAGTRCATQALHAWTMPTSGRAAATCPGSNPSEGPPLASSKWWPRRASQLRQV